MSLRQTIRLSIPLFERFAFRQPAKRVGISTRFSRCVPATRMGCCVVNGPVPQTLLIRAVFTCDRELYLISSMKSNPDSFTEFRFVSRFHRKTFRVTLSTSEFLSNGEIKRQTNNDQNHQRPEAPVNE